MTTLTPQNAIRRSRARRRQRGALAMEGIIVAVMMVGIVLGTWYMRQVYSGKLLTITASRADAWKESLSGCDSGNQGKLYDSIHEQSKDPNAKICSDPKDCSGSNADGLSDDPTDTSTPDWFPSSTSPQVSKSLTVSNESYTANLTTTREFSCNEKPAKRELELGSLDLLSGVVDMVKKIPDEEVDNDTTAQTCWQGWLDLKNGFWHQMNCQTDWVFTHNLDPLHSYSHTSDLDVDAPDNSKN